MLMNKINNYTTMKTSNKMANRAGKYPRFLIILTVIIVIFAAINLWLIFWYIPNLANNNIKNISSKYKFLDPTQGFYEKKDLIVNIQPLRDELNEIGKNKDISIYFEYLPTGANIAVNKDLALWPGSLMKIPVAMAVMKKVENKEWKLENELVLFNEDKDQYFGELYKEPIGTRFTIKKLLEEMLINSDNTATLIFMRNIERKELDGVLAHLGIEDILNSDQKITAKNYSIFWRSLFTSSFLSLEHSQQLLELMTLSPAINYLKQGMPENIIFSHKIGVLDSESTYSDSGIVYIASRSYILTVMMREPDQKKMKQTMKEISEKVYRYIASY